uniref:rRNA N6-adenosine-methyltransferase ZCCHC4-like isoform X2 n=1 Tax=Styela clava TaxID=7725 RepID=UPI001939F837|nr:rRNA N6-adenosine-methyltransferase ZCCHC4-like isoform X2 [Styela clava]
MTNFSAGTGIEVFFIKDWYASAPRCRHGPMLLFEKFIHGKCQGRRYYACSACRSRKECDAFLYEDDYNRKNKCGNEIHIGQHQDDGSFLYECTFKGLASLSPSERSFCRNCQIVRLEEYRQKPTDKCFQHDIIKSLSLFNLFHPSREILPPLQEDKKNAQYFLNDRSLNFILDILLQLKFTHIVCIGMPSLHEEIQYRKYFYHKNSEDITTIIDSILLDIDKRYEQFSDQDKFCHFNMFNHYFIDESFDKLRNFVEKSESHSRICLVLDPPFGGLVDAIANTLKWISSCSFPENSKSSKTENLLPILWIFPYFMEKRITGALPSLHMLDYQVNYNNHNKFKKKITSTRISPVRIFTNIKTNDIVFPVDEGYRFCSRCDRYVAESNKHCKICNNCPSKDGRTYVHCNECNFCVKPGRKHCKNCERCELDGHECRKTGDLLGCHLCGKLTHKRRDCPLKNSQKNNDILPAKTIKTKANHAVFHRKSSHLKKRKYTFS